jgi:hypothetical protein
MMMHMKHRLLTLYITTAVLLAPVIAFAASKEDEETVRLEARMEGYASSVHTPGGSTSLTWIMIGFLSVVTIACLFKNAKRTHLD